MPFEYEGELNDDEEELSDEIAGRDDKDESWRWFGIGGAGAGRDGVKEGLSFLLPHSPPLEAVEYAIPTMSIQSRRRGGNINARAAPST